MLISTLLHNNNEVGIFSTKAYIHQHFAMWDFQILYYFHEIRIIISYKEDLSLSNEVCHALYIIQEIGLLILKQVSFSMEACPKL